MSPWILIIILLNGGGSNVAAGKAITTIDFPDRETCELGAHQVRQMVEPVKYGYAATGVLLSCIRRAP